MSAVHHYLNFVKHMDLGRWESMKIKFTLIQFIFQLIQIKTFNSIWPCVIYGFVYWLKVKLLYNLK